ncbi:hypothetical protein QQ020_04630 [Fulvivirgaceae bacterium BMA12]|uniref:Uncharacterized protein n=1 Tax=Agaribacillus aureus TaxID=3051825 RepID=A0ABT8L0T9_9BACT|nr:hypothetical protein [Fulvivirgaceae bacterium BMA12]
MDGILMGIIFSNFALNFNPTGIGWDKLSNFLGYVFIGFLGGLIVGVITAITLSSTQLRNIFNLSLGFIILMLIVIGVTYA